MSVACACGRVAWVADRWCRRCFVDRAAVDLYMDLTARMDKPQLPQDATHEEVQLAAAAWCKENAAALDVARERALAEWRRLRTAGNAASRRSPHSAGVEVR